MIHELLMLSQQALDFGFKLRRGQGAVVGGFGPGGLFKEGGNPVSYRYLYCVFVCYEMVFTQSADLLLPL